MALITVADVQTMFRKDKGFDFSDPNCIPDSATVEAYITDIQTQIDFSLQKGLIKKGITGYSLDENNPYLKYICKIGVTYRIEEVNFESLMKEADSRVTNLKKEFFDMIGWIEDDPTFIDPVLLAEKTGSPSPVYFAPDKVFSQDGFNQMVYSRKMTPWSL